MQSILKKYKAELQQELHNILQWWMRYSIDNINGGFYGKINNRNEPIAEAEKGLVLNARILWTFSAAYNYSKSSEYLTVASRAYNYIIHHFIDKKNGGLYWSVNYKGQPLNKRKQIYGQAFAVYGLSEYYKASKNERALQQAIELFNVIEKYSFDEKQNGHWDAFSEDWNIINDMRLSEKDANEKKTMNTHLHLVEAYTNLYSCQPDKKVKTQIKNLIEIFLQHIIDPNTFHLHLFFDESWEIKNNIISFGHDIEASWLLLEAAEITGDEALAEKVKKISTQMAGAVFTGIDKDGGVKNELTGAHWNNEKHWWAQAEAMVGFFNAYQISRQKNYLQQSLYTWDFIQKNIIDKKNGEWFWGIGENKNIMEEDKAGFWKCPYHNARACMEIVKRIDNIFSRHSGRVGLGK